MVPEVDILPQPDSPGGFCAEPCVGVNVVYKQYAHAQEPYSNGKPERIAHRLCRCLLVNRVRDRRSIHSDFRERRGKCGCLVCILSFRFFRKNGPTHINVQNHRVLHSSHRSLGLGRNSGGEIQHRQNRGNGHRAQQPEQDCCPEYIGEHFGCFPQSQTHQQHNEDNIAACEAHVENPGENFLQVHVFTLSWSQ